MSCLCVECVGDWSWLALQFALQDLKIAMLQVYAHGLYSTVWYTTSACVCLCVCVFVCLCVCVFVCGCMKCPASYRGLPLVLGEFDWACKGAIPFWLLLFRS